MKMIDKRLHDLFAMEERKRKIVFENLPQPKKLFYKKDNNLYLLSDFIVFVAYTKRKFF